MTKNKKIQLKGDKEGYCNICRNHTKLTRDHIPPRGCVKPKTLELVRLSKYLSNSSQQPTISQSGLNLLSLCGNCNNSLLGNQYDPELIELTKKVARLVRLKQDDGLSLPEQITFSVKPQRLIRAIIGHILAGQLRTPGQSPVSKDFPNALRDYFLDQSTDIPDKLDIYYWIYPSKRQILINGLAIALIAGKEDIAIIGSSSLLKFFPLAFWLVWDKPTSFPISARKIQKEQVKGLDETWEMVVDLRNIPRLDYPEFPDEDKFIMFRDDLTFLAHPKKPK